MVRCCHSFRVNRWGRLCVSIADCRRVYCAAHAATYSLVHFGHIGFFLVVAAAAFVWRLVSSLWEQKLPVLPKEALEEAADFISKVCDARVARNQPTLVAVGAYAIQLAHAESFARLLEDNVNKRLVVFANNCENESEPNSYSLRQLIEHFLQIRNDLVLISGNLMPLKQLCADCPDAATWKRFSQSIVVAIEAIGGEIAYPLETIQVKFGKKILSVADKDEIKAALVVAAKAARKLLADTLEPLLKNVNELIPVVKARFSEVSKWGS